MNSEQDQLLDAIQQKVMNVLEPYKKAQEEIGLELKRLGISTFQDQKPIIKILESKKGEFENLKSGQARSVKFSIPIEKATATTGSITNSTLSQRLPDIGQAATLRPTIRSLFRAGTVGPNSGGKITYLDQDPDEITRGAAMRSENTQKPESAIEWVEHIVYVRKVADTIPFSKELLDDYAGMEAELQRFLNTNLTLKIDQQLWDGDDVAPALQGVYDLAPSYTYGGDDVEDPNLADLINLAKADMMDNKDGKYSPNIVVMNGKDLAFWKTKKTTIGTPLIEDIEERTGLTFIESGQVTANTLLIGDFRFGTVYSTGSVEVSIGHIDKQFVENTMTMLAEERLTLVIRNVDADAFLKIEDIAAGIGSLTNS